ncbi:MAG: DUF4397 domain-containing protein [Anaerolineae bacterium]|nr:DUF4397 domain-containing protein [Anaerolineae bacterium]
MKFNNSRIGIAVSLLLAVLLSVFGTQASAQTTGGARLRFVHAVPGAPAVDVSVDNVVAARNLAYASATRFIIVPAGDHTVTLSAGGKQVFQGKVTAPAGLTQTVIAEGTADAITAAVYEDDLGPVAAGNTRLTASSAIKDAPPVDVVRGDGSPLIQGLKFGEAYGAFDIPATAIKIAVVPAGGDINAAIVQADNLPLTAGTHNRLVALGTLDGSTKPSYLLLTAATDPEDAANSKLVRFVHAVPGAPAVDVYVGDKLVAPALAFGDYTPHLALASAAADVSVRTAGSAADSAVLVKAALTNAKAQTVVIAEAGGSAVIQLQEENVGQLAPTTARINVINAAGGTATVKIGSATATASTNQPGQASEVPPGVYDMAASVDNPALQLAASQQPISGGVLYDVIVAGNAQSNKLIVAATGLNEQPNSAPGAGTAVAQATSPATQAATQPPQPATQQAQPTAVPPTEAAPTDVPPTAVPPTEAAAPPTDVPPTPEPPEPTVAEVTPTQPPVQPPAQVTPQGTIATVNTNQGVNLLIREYPRTNARTLALVPSGDTLVVTGVIGAVPPTGTLTPTAVGTREPTPTISAEGVTLDKVWLFITWQAPGGGTVTGWVNAQYVSVTKNGRQVFAIIDLLTLKQIPADTPGEINSTAITPVGASTNNIIGTVTVDEGRNLQLRRTPGVDGESLALLPNGANVVVISKTEIPLKGLVGEPNSPIWLYVRYEAENSTLTGWVNLQYIKLTRNQRPFDVAEVPKATEIFRGDIQGAATAVKPPPAPGIVATVNKLDAGANLQFRRNPDATSESLGLIPSGTELPVLGRNGSGNWIQVRYNNVDGWVNIQFVTITKAGKVFNIPDITIVTGEKDTTSLATPGPSPTATGTSAQ